MLVALLLAPLGVATVYLGALGAERAVNRAADRAEETGKRLAWWALPAAVLILVASLTSGAAALAYSYRLARAALAAGVDLVRALVPR